MLDKKVFKQEIERLLHFFPGWEVRHDNPETMKAWYDIFKDMTDEGLAIMVTDYIKKEVYLPTVAGLTKYRPTRRLGVPPSKSVLGPREDDWM